MEAKRVRELETIAWKIRKMTLEMIQNANSGHIGGSFSIADILAALYYEHMRIDPAHPDMEDRDRLILSKGHCAPALYAALALCGFFPEEDLKGFRKIDGYLSGHVEMTKIPGADMSSGSLGQGLSVGIGMALSARVYAKDYHTYVILGDGEIEEGQIWEAAMAANKYQLDNLTAIIDCNKIQLDGTTEDLMPLEPLRPKWESFGWNVIEVNGHQVDCVAQAIGQALETKGKPTVILADTVKGRGVSIFENQVRFHGGRPTPEEYQIAYREINQKLSELER